MPAISLVLSWDPEIANRDVEVDLIKQRTGADGEPFLLSYRTSSRLTTCITPDSIIAGLAEAAIGAESGVLYKRIEAWTARPLDRARANEQLYTMLAVIAELHDVEVVKLFAQLQIEWNRYSIATIRIAVEPDHFQIYDFLIPDITRQFGC